MLSFDISLTKQNYSDTFDWCLLRSPSFYCYLLTFEWQENLTLKKMQREIHKYLYILKQ